MLARIAALVLVALGVATYLYFRSLTGAILEESPLEIRRATGAPQIAREGNLLRISEEDLNRLLFPDVNARITLAEPYARVKLSQPQDGKHLNAELLVALHPAVDGLAMHVLSGRVGKVSISGTSGEWVRTRIERQLAFELARAPRVKEVFAGAREVKVEGGVLVVRF